MPTVTIAQRSELDTAEISSIEVLVNRCRDVDGVSPLNEAALLALGGSGHEHWLSTDGSEVIGYVQVDAGEGQAQGCIDPPARQQGYGSSLLAAVADRHPTVAWWAFGDLPTAQALLTDRGYAAQRRLAIMTRTLSPLDSDPGPTPDGYRIRSFRADDRDAVLAVNAAAFADHPEQGQLDVSGFEQRAAQPWFDRHGLLVATTTSGRIDGFHWTKRHDPTTGEVYVLGVSPQAAGHGLGRALLTAGLAYLWQIGVRRVLLYVESDNTAALALYRSAGFDVDRWDALYLPPHEGDHRE